MTVTKETLTQDQREAQTGLEPQQVLVVRHYPERDVHWSGTDPMTASDPAPALPGRREGSKRTAWHRGNGHLQYDNVLKRLPAYLD